jgi:bacterioferritin-associated ferredoxin
MIICSCSVLSDHEVRSLASAPDGLRSRLRDATFVGTSSAKFDLSNVKR